jgi:hypothetical protein
MAMYPATTAPQHQQSQEELRQALREQDAAISADRAELDTLARGRQYRKLTEVATRLAARAKTAQQQAEQLDRLMSEASARKK